MGKLQLNSRLSRPRWRVPLLACPAVQSTLAAKTHCWASQQWHPV